MQRQFHLKIRALNYSPLTAAEYGLKVQELIHLGGVVHDNMTSWLLRGHLNQACQALAPPFKLSLSGLCFVTADLRFTQASRMRNLRFTKPTRMRKVRRDLADMNPLESDNKLVTYHFWFACLLSDLQADSRTRVRSGGAPLMPPRYLHLDLPKHLLRNVSRFRMRAHTLTMESSIWRALHLIYL